MDKRCQMYENEAKINRVRIYRVTRLKAHSKQNAALFNKSKENMVSKTLSVYVYSIIMN